MGRPTPLLSVEGGKQLTDDLNRIQIEGSLTRNPSLRYTAGGMAVSLFAITNVYHSKETSYFEVSAIGAMAETCAKRRQGDRVKIMGRLKQERWDSEDGTTHRKIVIYAEHILYEGEGG